MSRRTNSDTRMARDRGVSDAVAFTLTFSIIMLSIGLLTIPATDRVTTYSEAQEIESADRAMQSFAATLENMETRGDQNRSLRLAMKDGNVRFVESELEVAGETYPVNGLEHEFLRTPQDVTITYTNGAVVRARGVSGTMSTRPNMVCREDKSGHTTAVVNIVNLTAGENIDVAVRGGRDIRLNEYAIKSDAPVTNTDRELNMRAQTQDIEVKKLDSSFTLQTTADTVDRDVWNQTFQDVADESAWERPDDASIRCPADSALVRVTTIELSVVESGL